MIKNEDRTPPLYTCNDYREEMILVGLHRQLLRKDLTEKERLAIEQEIRLREKAMGL